jgi:hypothetical protein
MHAVTHRTFAEGHGPEVIPLILNVCKDVFQWQASSAVVGNHVFKDRQVLVAPARLQATSTPGQKISAA